MAAGWIDKILDASLSRSAFLRVVGPNGAATGPKVALCVTKGMHAGASMDLVDRFYTIGSSTASDIVLRDAGIVAVHARLRSKGGRFEIEAAGGDVFLAGAAIIPQGHGRRGRLPFEASIGGAQIKVAVSAQERVKSQVSRRPLFVGLGVGVAVLVMAAAANGISLAKPERNPQSASATILRQKPIPVHGPRQQVAVAEAATQLRMRLSQAALDTLNVRDAQGRLIVEGSLQKRQAENWTEVRLWFDQAYGANVLLVSNVDVEGGAHAPRIPLQAIWYGQPPYIITADGARYYEGAFVEDGWTIAEIGEKELLLTKSGATVALKYP